MPEESLKKKTVRGIAWSAVERFSAQGIQFVFNILIARILMPEDYGVVAMLNIFIAVANTFIDSGFGMALIRKTNRTETDYNTVFIFNVIVSLFFWGLFWLLAPTIADFYNIDLLKKVTRILSFTLIIGAFGVIPSAKLSICLDFKRKAYISIITIFVVGAVGLYMALKGFGVWALVAQNVVGGFVRTVLLCYFVKWRPRLQFSLNSFKELFGFGSKLLVSSLLDAIYNNVYTIVIGKVYSPKSLGVYNRSESFASFPSSNIYGIINSVSFPVLCSIQDDKDRLFDAYRKFVRLSAYIVFPLMLGLVVVSDSFIRVVLTDKWQDSIPLLRILCFALILYPLDAMNLNFPTVMGKSDKFLRVMVINKILDVIVLVVTIPIGLTAVCWGRVFMYVVCFFINTYYPKKLIGYGAFEQLGDLKWTIIHSVLMGVIVYLSIRIFSSYLIKLIVGILVGALYYWGASKLFKLDEYRYLVELVNRKKE